MTKNKAFRLLNEALAGRFVTEVGCEGVVDQSLGKLFMPYLEVGGFLKVIIGYAFSTASQADEELGELLRNGLVGRRVLEIAGEGGAGIWIEDLSSPVPIWNVGAINFDGTCQLSRVLLESGLQVPYEVVNEGGDDASDAEPDEDEDDEDDNGMRISM
jgi:hypothetical protein